VIVGVVDRVLFRHGRRDASTAIEPGQQAAEERSPNEGMSNEE
jgi:hypothetical protein